MDLAVNVAVLFALWWVYSAVRGVTADELSTATANAASLLNLQDRLGLPSERQVQSALLRSEGVARSANTYYLAVHFPLTAGFLFFVWARHRDHLSRVRNSLIGVTAVGMAIHVAFPLAPPRMIDGFVDTAARFGPNPYGLSIASGANQIAAMPSLHVGWALIVSLAVIWMFESRLRWLALAHPLCTAGVVVVTANHYWLDAIVAVALVVALWVMTDTAPRRRAEQPDAILGHG